MTVDEARAVMASLRDQIRHHNRLYYEMDQPVISDAEYDQLVQQLDRLEKEFPELADPHSPLRTVGGAVNTQFSVVRFEQPVLSLNNVHSLEEFREFDLRLRHLLNRETVAYTAELKIDGLTVVVDYEDGQLVRAATRGDGMSGEDVTANVRAIKEVPKTLARPVTGQFRGEIFMPKSVFFELNRSRQEEGGAPFANPRNAAAGSLRQLDPEVTAHRQLSAFFYQIRMLAPGQTNPQTQSDALRALADWGLPVDTHWRRCDTVAAVEEYIRQWQDPQSHDALDFEIDGLVIKLDDLNDQEVAGATQKAPRWAVAYKFAPQEVLTRVRAITLSVGRTGVLTPTAELDPVQLAGTQVSRASLHNEDIIRERDVRVGDAVWVRKAGEIIPEVVRVELSLRPPGTAPFQFPDRCPVCGGQVVRLEGESAVRCTAGLQCPAQLREALIHFGSRDAMDIEGLGEKTVDLLLEAGLVTTVADLYRLTVDGVRKLPRFGLVLAEKLVKGIQASRGRPLSRLLFGLGIRFVGAKAAKIIADRFGSMEGLLQATRDDLTAIHEIGERIADSVVEFLHEPHNRAVIEQLAELGVNMVEPRPPVSRTGVLTGRTVVVTGTLRTMTRKEIESFIKAEGGHVAGSVSSRTSFVVAGEEAGTKLVRAKALGIPVYTEDEFFRWIEKGASVTTSS